MSLGSEEECQLLCDLTPEGKQKSFAFFPLFFLAGHKELLHWADK